MFCSYDLGDLHKLMYPVRVQISKMLDPPCEGGDWIALANALGLFELMDSQSPGYSQTRVLLNFYEVIYFSKYLRDKKKNIVFYTFRLDIHFKQILGLFKVDFFLSVKIRAMKYFFLHKVHSSALILLI